MLVASGYNQDADREEAEAFGVQGFLGKPFSLRDLSALVRAVLDEAGASPSH